MKILDAIKKDIMSLYDANLIRPYRYAEWISNIVPLKKDGKIRIYIVFRDLNRATPKDEYPMSIVDLLVDVDVEVTQITTRYLWLKRIF
jgi:hypothetical protein